MAILSIRKILIDNVGDGNPFVSVFVDKVILNEAGEVVQVVGNFGRLYKRASQIPSLPVGTIPDDGVIDSVELFNIVATTAYIWMAEEYGGQIIDGKVVIP